MTDTSKNEVLRAYLQSEIFKCQARQKVLHDMMLEIDSISGCDSNKAADPSPQNLVDSIIPRSEQITTAVLRPSQPEGPAQITHSILSGGPTPPVVNVYEYMDAQKHRKKRVFINRNTGVAAKIVEIAKKHGGFINKFQLTQEMLDAGFYKGLPFMVAHKRIASTLTSRFHSNRWELDDNGHVKLKAENQEAQ